MYDFMRRTILASAALALSLLSSNAGAQAIYGSAEFDTDDFTMFFLGGSMSASGLGWKPYGAVSAYTLHFPGVTRNVVVPTVGLVNRTNEGSVSFGVGYAFSDKDFDQPLLVPAESGSGIIGSVQWNHWGSGDHALQLLGSYNFGTQFFWTRGRASRPLATQSPLWVGGEASVFGGGDPSASMAQLGPTVEWRFSPQFRLGGSAGIKFGLSSPAGVDLGNPAYGRVEFLWLPRAR